MRERSARFVFDRDAALPSLTRLVAGIGRATVEHEYREEVCFDTPDLRLTRGGASLRYRSAGDRDPDPVADPGSGWIVELPDARTGAPLVRREPGGAGPPPLATMDLARAWIRSAPVVEVVRLRSSRLKITIVDGAGRTAGEIVDDDVTAWRPGRSAPKRFREVGVRVDERVDGAVAQRLIRKLRTRARAEAVRPPVVRGLGRAALAAPDLATSEQVAKRATTADVVRAALTRSVRRLLESDPVIRTGEDPEAVHRARVATRRLRSDLKTFAPALDVAWSEALRSELRWLGEQLGRVRDADVLLGLLTAKAGSEAAAHEEGRGLHALTDRLEDARRRDRDALVDAMGSTRYAVLLERLVEAARAPRIRKGWKHRRATRAARALTRRPRQRLRKAVRALPSTPADAELHEVRKRAKQARYAFEAFAPVTGRAERRTARALADLQGVLGDHLDMVVAAAWLSDAAGDPDRPESAFVAGVLAGELAADRRRLRKQWPRVWKRVRAASRQT